jgi:hypothetical protein
MWQSVRDNLVFAAFTISLVSLCAALCTLALALSKRRQSKKKVNNEVEV